MQKPTFKHEKVMRKQAFTLIELLIVIAIIGILFIVLVSKVDFATDKAKATGVQTDFRSFQLAFEHVSREYVGFNMFGWNTGDTNVNGVRDSVDEGDTNKDGIMQSTETWTGRQKYIETWTDKYSLIRPGTTFASDGYDKDAIFALETAINKNLDPKLHITIDAKTGLITMANGAQDPWNTQYHGAYISAEDGIDRGAIVMHSNGANQKFGTKVKIENGVVTAVVSMVDADTPDNNKHGQDDYTMSVVYSYANGFGEVGKQTWGFSNNQDFFTGNGNLSNNGANVNPDNPSEPDDPSEPAEPSEPYEDVRPGLYETGSNYTVLIKSWDDMVREEIILFDEYHDRTFELNGDLKMPDDMTVIPPDAFAGSAITSVILPKDCITINNSAFQNCTNLETIVMYENVTTCNSFAIEDVDTFYFNGTLEQWCAIGGKHSGMLDGTNKFYINNELVEYIDFREHPTITKLPSYVFSGYQGLKSVIIGEFLTNTNSYYCFARCKNLKNVEIYTDINGDTWFADLGELETVYIGGNLNGTFSFRNVYIDQIRMSTKCKFIGDYTFFAGGGKNVFYEGTLDEYLQTTLTTNMSHPSYAQNAEWYFNGEKLENIIIDDVAKINDFLFYGTNIKTLSIGESVKEIGIQSFYRCKQLESINLSEGLEIVNASAFADCSEAIINFLPNSLKIIENNAFFKGPKRTGDLVISDNVEKIGVQSFYYWLVSSVKIGNGVKTIDENAFNNCTNVRTMIIGSGVQSIGKEAFLDMKSLRTVTILAEIPPTFDHSFQGCNSLSNIYVPAESVAAYKNADGWSAYSDIIQAMP